MQTIDQVIDQINQAFRPRPIVCLVNGRTHFIEKITEGWAWRNEDGDTQEDFGIEPFREAWQAQQSAISHRGAV